MPQTPKKNPSLLNPRGNPRPMEEERRSCFVAVTRAMQELILVHTHDRPYKGNSWMREPSRFLLAMGCQCPGLK